MNAIADLAKSSNCRFSFIRHNHNIQIGHQPDPSPLVRRGRQRRGPFQQHRCDSAAIHRNDGFLQLIRQPLVAPNIPTIDLADILAEVLR